MTNRTQKLTTLSEINFYLKELDDGYITKITIADEHINTDSMTMCWICDGGAFESGELFIQFTHVTMMHLGVSLSERNLGFKLDELKQINASKMRDILPPKLILDIDSVYYRFYSQGVATPYYIGCEKMDNTNHIKAWIDGTVNEAYQYKG